MRLLIPVDQNNSIGTMIKFVDAYRVATGHLTPVAVEKKTFWNWDPLEAM